MKSVKACPDCGKSLEIVTTVGGALLGYFCGDTTACGWIECQSAEELKWEMNKEEKRERPDHTSMDQLAADDVVAQIAFYVGSSQ